MGLERLGRTIGERLATARLRRAVARCLARLDPAATLRDEIEEWAAEHGDRLALAATDGSERTSFAALAGRAHRWARWAILHGAAPGEPIALLVANRPERVAAWLGLAEAGATAMVIDEGLDGPALAAALTRLAPRRIVVDAALLSRFETATPHLALMAAVWVHGPHAMAYPRHDEALADLSPERLRPADRRAVTASDPAVGFIDDAGTMVLDHADALHALHAAAAALRLGVDDRLFVTPATGLSAVLAPGIGLAAGALGLLGADTTALADALARHRPTVLALGPDDAPPAASPRRILGLGPATAGRRDLVWDGAGLATADGDLLWSAAPPSAR